MNNPTITIPPELLDPICKTGLLDSNLFPVGSGHAYENISVLPFLCDLLKATTDNNASPLLTNPPSGFDITPFTDFSMLTAIGDHRASLGEVMTQTYINFLPRVIVQNEVRQNGGTQVINNYICDSDGNPIKNIVTGPIMLSIDLNGKKSYQYGAITVPPVSASYQDLLKPLDPSEITQFVFDYVSGKNNYHAQQFAFFIEEYLPDWTVKSVDVYDLNGYLIVTLTQGVSNLYLKYYGDVGNAVGCYLQQKSINHYTTYQFPDNMTLSYAEASIIPDYNALMSNPTSALNFKQQVLNLYVTNSENTYTNMYSDTGLFLQNVLNNLGINASANTFQVQVPQSGQSVTAVVSSLNC